MTSDATTTVVIGASGQLGAEVVAQLRTQGRAVRAFVRRSSASAALAAAGAELAYGDLADAASVAAACRGAGAVIATASSIVPGRGDRFGAADVAWYRNIVAACREQRVHRLVYISAFSSPHDARVPEFGIKRAIEALIAGAGVPYTIFRGAAFMDVYFAVMGSALPLAGAANPTLDRAFWLTRLFGRTLRRSIDRHGLAIVPGNGRTRHAFIAIRDVAAFMVAAAADGSPDSGTFDIAGPAAPSWHEVAALYAGILHRRVRVLPLPAPLLAGLRGTVGRASPAAGNLLAILELLGRHDYAPDMARTAQRFGVTLTTAEAFLRSKKALAEARA